MAVVDRPSAREAKRLQTRERLMGAAIAEFKRSLSKNPKHEKTLEFIIQALVRQGNNAEATKYLSQLRESDPTSSALPGLTTQVEEQTAPK